ncbi:MAG: hypothetical protein AAGF72_09435 [Pseudomonadota bacterium]
MIIQEFGKTLIFQGLVVVCFQLLLSGSVIAGRPTNVVLQGNPA